MATLVFTAVGTALGGPLGGAIGSLLGQSFDQQLFGSTRHGPRLGDLSVQTSTYGTPVPRIYGTMRVAGSVIWATDLQESSTQTGAKGQPILLLDQDRGRWDRILIQRGLAALARASELAGSPGPYALQAAIAACHARARTAGDTDWARIAELYAELGGVAPSPVVELNRAVAVGMAEGPAPALGIVDALAAGGKLDGSHLLPSVRGDLLAKLGRHEEARAEFERAASLTRNSKERDLLLARAQSGT